MFLLSTAMNPETLIRPVCFLACSSFVPEVQSTVFQFRSSFCFAALAPKFNKCFGFAGVHLPWTTPRKPVHLARSASTKLIEDIFYEADPKKKCRWAKLKASPGSQKKVLGKSWNVCRKTPTSIKWMSWSPSPHHPIIPSSHYPIINKHHWPNMSLINSPPTWLSIPKRTRGLWPFSPRCSSSAGAGAGAGGRAWPGTVERWSCACRRWAAWRASTRRGAKVSLTGHGPWLLINVWYILLHLGFFNGKFVLINRPPEGQK